jgi:hypothetical protein
MKKDYESIEKLLEDLNCKYMSLVEYYSAVDKEMLPLKKVFEDDYKFQIKYPDHPLSTDNTSRRMTAADTILFFAEQERKVVVPIEVINEHILDCCAAVRLSLVQALLYIGDKSSVPYLEILFESEKESKMVKDNCSIVLEVLDNDLTFISDRALYYEGEYNDEKVIGLIRVKPENSGLGSVVYVGNVKDENAEGVGKLYDKFSGQLIYEGGFSNNIFNGSGRYYNDDGSIKCEGIFINGKSRKIISNQSPEPININNGRVVPGKVWLHRISHEMEVSYPLLEKGFVTIGFSAILNDKTFAVDMMNKELTQKDRWGKFEDAYKTTWGGELRRSRFNLWRFITQFKAGDYILIPSWGVFSIFKIVGEAEPISNLSIGIFKDKNKKEITLKDGLLQQDNQEIDLGFFVKVEAVAIDIPREDYAKSGLTSRMKMRQTNADISDLIHDIEDVINAFKNNKPINLYANVIDNMSENLLEKLSENLNDAKFERLIKWYFEKLGASEVEIPAKNEGGKNNGADADIIATFETIKVIIYIQAKYHTGETDDWAVTQIAKYKEQKEDVEGEYKYVPWVISTCSKFSEKAITNAQLASVRLLNGLEFAQMLIDIGVKDINSAF